jgi:hypothetical protein
MENKSSKVNLRRSKKIPSLSIALVIKLLLTYGEKVIQFVIQECYIFIIIIIESRTAYLLHVGLVIAAQMI